jgi:thioesterase domain-containing protein
MAPNPDFKTIFPAKSTGYKTPLFLVHGLPGYNPGINTALANYFDRNRPLYAVQASGLDNRSAPYEDVEAMAAHYVREMRHVLPEGPYLLGGLCLGGSIAFEMARQVRKETQEVSAIVMVDSPFPLLSERELAWLADDVSAKSKELVGHAAPYWRYGTSEELVPPESRNQFRVWKANVKAVSTYRPLICGERLIYFSATDPIAEKSFFDPARPGSWKDLTSRSCEIHSISGNHLSILFEPRVKTLADMICACLDHVDVLD